MYVTGPSRISISTIKRLMSVRGEGFFPQFLQQQQLKAFYPKYLGWLYEPKENHTKSTT